MRWTDLTETSEGVLDGFEFIDGPDLYLHYAATPEAVRAIAQNGFDLSRFGQTAKRFRSPLGAFDPRGVYATAFEGNVDPARPWVVFRLSREARVLAKPDPAYPGEGLDIKSELSGLFKATGTKLATALRKQGVDVVQSLSEFIILDPGLIQIVKTSGDRT